MAHVLLRRQAIELRKLGKSYGQIKDVIHVSKSTLSEWLRTYPLTKEQICKLNHNDCSVERFRQTMQKKREEKLLRYYREEKDTLLPFTKRELLIAGIFLYWGEGTKTGSGVCICNTDPALVKFSLIWMTKALDIPKQKIQVLVHLYKDMNIDKYLNYWSKLLNIPRAQFVKPYIKTSNKSDIDYKGYGYGTCNLRVSDVELKKKILMALEVIRDYSRDSVFKL